MIPGPFAYHRPKSVSEAVALLGDLGEEARPLAGGHSIIPMMKLRMAAPDHLIDLAAISELKGVSREGDVVTIGAMITQAELIASDLLAGVLPIIRETSLQIADPQIRAMGTLGGNVANGDPGNDLPALMMALNATYTLTSRAGSRQTTARTFYFGPYDTALQPGELLTSVLIPVPPSGHGYAYEKLKRKVGDYATAAAAVLMTVANGKITSCAVALTNLADVPLYCEEAGNAVVGSELGHVAVAFAKREAEKMMSPASDGRGPAEYRVSVGGIMVARALKRAFAIAKG